MVIFGQKKIGSEQPTFVVAEIGINHEGSTETALKMVRASFECGANAIKLQTADPDENYSKGTKEYDIYSRSFLGPEATASVFAYAKQLGLEFFTTSGMKTFEWIEKLRPSGYKISSGTLTHIPLIKLVASSKRPIMFSTGVATFDDISRAIKAATTSGCEEMILMQCTSLYPCPDECVDLSSIRGLEKKYNKICGFSDHTPHIDTASYAVAAGAKVIEKHISLDPKRNGFDHSVSLDPRDFSSMVKKIRYLERLMGSENMPLRAENMASTMQRLIFTNKTVKKGEKIKETSLKFMRSKFVKGAISAADTEKIIGSISKIEIAANTVLCKHYLDQD